MESESGTTVSTKTDAAVDNKSTGNAEPPREAVQQVRAWLDKRVQLELSDGRVVEGVLECFDKLGNMILGDAYELRQSGTRFPLGLVLAPSPAVMKICVRRSVPPPAEGLIGNLSIGDTL